MRQSAPRDPTRTDPFRWPVLAAAISVALGASIVLTTIQFVWLSYFVGPFDDFWHFIALLVDVEEGASWVEFWLRPFGAHRILVGKMWNWIEVSAFGGRNVFLTVACCLVQAAWPITLIRVLLADRVAPALVWFFSGVSFALMFSGTQLSNFVQPWQIAYVTYSTSACLSFYCMTKLQRNPSGNRAWLWLGGAILAGLVTSYSMGAGILVWPALLVMCFLLRTSRWVSCLIATVAGVVLWTFLTIAASQSIPTDFTSLKAAGRWLTACLGVPLSMTNFRAGCWVGGIGAVAGLVSGALALIRRDRNSMTEVLTLALMTFAGGGLILTALGRATLWPTLWSSPRYQLLALVFWLALLVLVSLQLLSRGHLSIGRHGPLWAAALAWIGFVILPAHFSSGSQYIRRAERIRAANVAMLMGVEAYPPYRITFPVMAGLPWSRPLRTYLREHRIGVFADGHQDLLGKRMNPTFDRASAGSCAGQINCLNLVGGLYAVVGRGHELPARGPLDLIVISEANGIITGLGLPVQRRIPWVASVTGDRPADRWLAYVDRSKDAAFDVWGILSTGEACLLTDSRKYRVQPAARHRHRRLSN